MLDKAIYVADIQNKRILRKVLEDTTTQEPEVLVDKFEEKPLIGPNSMALATKSSYLECLHFLCVSMLGTIYFTDSGGFCETSIENPKGSVFLIDLDAKLLRPLSLHCLAYPTGLALSPMENVLYVSETCQNRVLRYSLTNEGVFFYT
jgi:sugar lactone lactonase YvrE